MDFVVYLVKQMTEKRKEQSNESPILGDFYLPYLFVRGKNLTPEL